MLPKLTNEQVNKRVNEYERRVKSNTITLTPRNFPMLSYTVYILCVQLTFIYFLKLTDMFAFFNQMVSSNKSL
jgi:hypothetical protein